MTNAKRYYLSKDAAHFDEIKQQASSQSLSGWEEYYWAGLYLYEYAPDGTYYELIVETLEESFFEGLTYLSNRDCYLNVVKVLGRIYLELQQYDLALNMFQMLVLKDPDVPDWIYLRYAYAQMNSDTAERLVDEPKYLFERLDRIDTADPNLVGQRNAIFQDFLILCAELHQKKEKRIDTDCLFDKAAEYGVLYTDAWKRFASAFPEVFGETTDVSGPVDGGEEPDVDAVVIQERLSKESRKRIFEFFASLVEDKSQDLTDAKRIQGLASDILAKCAKEKNIIRLAAAEGAVAIMVRGMGSEEVYQRVAFSNARRILLDNCGFGEGVATDIVVEIARAFKYTIDLEDFETEDSDEAIDSFSDHLVTDLEKENQELLDKIHRLQDEMRDLMRKNQDFERLLEEKKAVIDRLSANEACIDSIERNAASGVTRGHDLLDGNKKILVIGQPVVSTDKLLGIVKLYGYEKNDFVFWDDYDKIKSYAERMAGGSFTGIIAGPMPHKVAGLGDYSSLIEKMKQPGYPHMEEARSEGGELKITKNSFRKALEEMTKHLLAIQ